MFIKNLKCKNETNKKYQVKDKVYTPCIILSKVKFRFDILKIETRILTELLKHLRKGRS